MHALLLLLCLAVPLSAAEPVKNPDTYTYLTVSDANTLDPAWVYDTASNLLIGNIYEDLFAFDGSSTEKLIPLLASKVPSKENGLISADGLTYRIPIRKGVRFQDGTAMTPEDARYSLLRFMLQDRASGPSAMLLEPLVGYTSTRDAKGARNQDAFKDAARAVRVDGDAVVLRLPRPYAPLLSILASWAPVVSKEWATKNGDWDGTEATWSRFNDPKKESSPFFEKAMGTGPFALERWDRQTAKVILIRNERYWRAPARLKRVVVQAVPEFATRKLMLQAGDADSIRAERAQLSQLKGIPGVQIVDGLSSISADPVLFFSFAITRANNPFIGSGRLDGAGIPPDFFADKDVRLGVAAALDYAGFIQGVYAGQGTQATGCIPKGLFGYDATIPTHRFDPAAAKAHFQKAWGGKVWEKGFKFTLVYHTGHTSHQVLAQMLKRSLENLNPRFTVDLRPIDWPAFLDASNSGKLPLAIMTWSVDYPDPHDFAFPLMHSKGVFPSVQKYANPEADRLIEQAVREPRPARRKALYRRLMEIERDDAPHIVIVDASVFRTQRTWVKGWVHNPVAPDPPYGGFFYPLYKAP
jgi:peptide/nickel transport system substrate-binding protein